MFDYDVLFILYKSGQYELVSYDDFDEILDLIILNFDIIDRIFEF